MCEYSSFYYTGVNWEIEIDINVDITRKKANMRKNIETHRIKCISAAETWPCPIFVEFVASFNCSFDLIIFLDFLFPIHIEQLKLLHYFTFLTRFLAQPIYTIQKFIFISQFHSLKLVKGNSLAALPIF